MLPPPVSVRVLALLLPLRQGAWPLQRMPLHHRILEALSLPGWPYRLQGT